MARNSYSKRGQRAKSPVKSLRVRSGDKVLVIAGEGKSNTPRKVLSVLPRSGKVLVEGVNVMKDSQAKRGNGGDNINSQDYIEKPCPIDASNVMLVDPQSSKPTRVKVVRQKGSASRRVAVKSGDEI
jgi:large subunit ribosomal protein L24